MALQWQEDSIILSSRLFTENSRIVTVFNASIGKTSGLVKNFKTPIQLGDISNVFWRGRSIDQLGTFKLENIFSPFTHIFNKMPRILALESACFLCCRGLSERAPHPKLYDALKALLLSISRENWLMNYAFFEINFLSEVGVGLDLSKCALTNKTEDLFYVSPRTGCAATRDAGEKYKDRLFILPKFLVTKNDNPSNDDIFRALAITEHFLKMYFYDISNGKLPLSRDYLMAELAEKIKGAA
ncbi:MAG: DNA repair protein RecO [Holosporaceae bacterium]|nr:DNA repair protein RecO [Holosporaceae bacterium]